MTATAMPISPARTPRRAVRGWLSHLSDRMNSAAATSARDHVDRGPRDRRAVRRRPAMPNVANSVNHGLRVSRRNIFSIRSVIQKPPTMLVVAAITASVPRNVLKLVFASEIT